MQVAGKMFNSLNPFAAKCEEVGIHYKITVKTGSTSGAGTQRKLKIKIFSEEGNFTKPVQLDNDWLGDFKAGNTQVYNKKLEHIGTPVLIELSLSYSVMDVDSLNLDYVAIDVNHESYHFPINKWISTTMQVPESRTITGHKPPCAAIRQYQRDWIVSMKAENAWAKKISFGLNGHFVIANSLKITSNTQWSNERQMEFISGAAATKVDKFVLMSNLQSKFGNLDDVVSGLVIPQLNHNGFDVNPHTVGNWQSDEEFAREQLDGSRPHAVAQVMGKIPGQYKIEDCDILQLLPEGKTLASEIAAGKIFMVDNSILEHIDCKKLYICSPLLLLYSDCGFLRPFAIQLHANREENNPVWTPNDSETDWLFAKICLSASNGNIQQVADHLILSHLILEPFACAMYRCLPTNHPIYCFLFQHLNTLPSINTLARLTLLPENGILHGFVSIAGNEVFQKRVWRNTNYDEFFVLKKLKKRGLMDKDLIQEFGYRDDSIEYWKIIEKYTDSMIKIFYKSDEDVANDFMLQDWIEETKNDGFKNWSDCALKTFPSKLETLDEVIQLMTAILFHVSVQHISEMNDMVNIYGNVAGNSLALTKPLPCKKGVTMKDIMDILPGRKAMANQMALFEFLEKDPSIPLKLGENPLNWFTQPEVYAVQIEFQKNLDLIKAKIETRNLSWKVPCTKFLPTNVQARIDK